MRTLWRFLTSLRTAIALIAMLSVLATVGTLIPQKREALDYLRAYPRAGRWIWNLGFDDVYHSIVFNLMLWLLALSALACTISRLRNTKLKITSRLASITLQDILCMPLKAELPAFDAASNIGTDWQIKNSENAELRLRVHGRLSLIGSAMIHVGLVVILIGALLSSMKAVEMPIRGMKGETVAVPSSEAIKVAADSDRLRRLARAVQQENQADPRLDEIRKRVEAMDAAFQAALASPACRVRFDDLWVDYSDASASVPLVKNWNSRITIIDSNGNETSGIVSVNSPFTWKNFTFYQADWSKKYQKVTVKLIDSVATGSASEIASLMTLEIGKPYKPECSSITFVLMDFFPDFRIVGERFVSLSEELKNPAGRILAYDENGNSVGRAWAFSREMAELAGHSSNLPYRFEVVSAEPVYETCLQISSDPGVTWVWLGCIVMTLGLFCTFYIAYYEEWLVIYPDGGVVAAVKGNRPPSMLQPVLENLKNSCLRLSAVDVKSLDTRQMEVMH